MASSHCDQPGLLVAVCGLLTVAVSLVAEHGFYGTWAQHLQVVGSRTWAQELWCIGLAAPWHVGSSWSRD